MASLTSPAILVIVLLSFAGASLVNDYDHFAALDPDEKIKLYWTIDKATQSVSFAVDGATTGWVGFGISTGQGKMNQADIVIGWVKDGKSFLTDRHGVGRYPKLDDHNDYKVISGEESNGRTILKFSRKIDTCDKQDRKLEEGTTKVIFALNDQDPASPNDVMKHTFKGVRSILLLNSQGNRNKPDSSWKHFDILNRNFDPVVQRGNEGVVHHIDIYVCDPNFPEHYRNFSGDCHDWANMPAGVLQCNTKGIMTAAWAIGGGAFVYPKHVGFPIGTKYAGRHFVMEVHYDNPFSKAGIVDNSGLRFYYTSNLRKYDAGVWLVGMKVSQWMMIPPKQEAWKTTGYCTKQCTEKALRNTSLPEGGIKFFSSVLHTHLAGLAAWTQHVRDGVELPEIARDDNYDFNFQDVEFLTKEVHFKPGDDVIHTCIYNTMDRDKPIYGGYPTRSEMCLDFLFYYPYTPSLTLYCQSTNLRAGAEMVKKYYPSLVNKGDPVINPIVRSNKTWTKKMTNDYKKFIDEETAVYSQARNPLVDNNSISELLTDKYQTPKVRITTPLPEPKDECNVYSSAGKIVGFLFYQVLSFCVVFLVF